MTPRELAETGWINKLSAEVVSRTGAGMEPEGRDIDYFVASRGWSSRIYRLQEQITSLPTHQPFTLWARSANLGSIKEMVIPAGFPKADRETEPPWAKEGLTGDSEADWASWHKRAEDYLSERCKTQGSNLYMGHGRGRRYNDTSISKKIGGTWERPDGPSGGLDTWAGIALRAFQGWKGAPR